MIINNLFAFAISAVLLYGIFDMQNSMGFHQECRSHDPNDIDGDGISDKMETNGIDSNRDGKIDLNLQELGASPLHKDLFLEIDYMENHKPYPSVIPDVVSSFKNAPLCNPDNSFGINLIVELDDQIPHNDSLDLVNSNTRTTHFNDFYPIKTKFFGNAEQRSDTNRENILVAKDMIYHYGLFIHTWNDQRYSGVAKDIPSKDFVVSLGYSVPPASWPFNPSTNHTTGTSTQQKGTLIHELGHTLGLGHGGSDHFNKKPDYLSRMNYHFQLDSIEEAPLDYSRCELNSLDEHFLIESGGVSESCPPNQKTRYYVECPSPLYPRGVIITTLTGIPVNWDQDNNTNMTYDKNINCDNYNDGSPVLIELKGHDDWNNLKYIGSSNLLGSSAIEPANRTNIQMQNNTINDTIASSGPIIEEMTPQDLQDELVGLITGIGYYVDNISNSSFKTPIVDVEGNLIESEAFDNDTDAPSLAKGYYSMILGTSPSTESEATFGDEAVSDTVIEDISQGDTDSAINKLENFVLNTADSSFGGQSSDDLIKDPENQLQLAQLVTSTINTLKAQSCLFDECK
jgi:hypothetical protein